MNFKSTYFKSVEEANGVAQRLVEDDYKFSQDRQLVANFYNGRDTMTVDQAEHQNVGNVVNHLFGYNSIDKLRAQITSLFTSGDTVWNIKVTASFLNVAERQVTEQAFTQALARRIRRSRRLRPEWRANSGNLVLHGRSVMMFADRFDWCPKVALLYVPQDARPNRESLPYGFCAEKLSIDKLRAYQKRAEDDKDSKWNLKALNQALDAIEPCNPTNPLVDKPVGGEKMAEHDNNSNQPIASGQMNTASTLPVWYVYEVDHSKKDKPVSLKILARYSILPARTPEGSQKKVDSEKDSLLYQNDNEFDSVTHWLVPFFIDTEIGGRPMWNSSVGIGKLNYPRDADVEEFFNIAMDGAKDAMRTKWAIADGASREKAMRFFADRQDIVPEGMTPVKIDTSGNYQHAFTIIDTLRSLSAEDSGTGISNTGRESDELEIQAAERQGAAQQLIAARMADIYDSLDDMGTEILRRFLILPVEEGDSGHCDIMLFRDELKARGISKDHIDKLADTEYGEFLHLEVKTNRALGDGSRQAELQTAQMLMGSLGVFGPQAQEDIKRRFALALTRDVDWANNLVPAAQAPNPDQIARARNENTAAASRGVIGFIPQVNPDDVNELHIQEHDQELDAMLKRGEDEGGLNEPNFAGFKALATHQAQHVKNLQGGEQTAEQANAWLQKLERQSTSAEGLYKAWQSRMQDEELTAAQKIQFQQKDRDQNLRERTQVKLEEERDFRRELDTRDLAGKEAKMVSDAATKAAGLTLSQIQPPATNGSTTGN